MTEEPKDPLDIEKNAVQEESEPVAVNEKESAEESAGEKKSNWPIVAIIAVVLTLLAAIACVGVVLSASSGGTDETPTPAPIPTQGPSGAQIVITEPHQGQVLDIDKPVTVQGKGIGLPEGNVVVEALDWQGNVLDRQPTTLQGRDVGVGGEGTWSVKLTIKVEPGTAGRIRAFSSSPKDGSIMAEAVVEVSLGRSAAVEAYIKIDQPAQGSTLDVNRPIRVNGTGAGLPEGNIVVMAADQNGNVLAEQPTTLQGADVGTGGSGTWSIELAVPASGQTPGYITAFSASPKQRDLVASDHVEVTFSGDYTLEGPTWLLDKTIPGSEVTALFANGQVAGTAGCNTYQGPYQSTQAVGKNNIQIGPLATTRMMCDEALANQEDLYLAALDSATSYAIKGFTLTITYPGGELLFYDKDGPRPRR